MTEEWKQPALHEKWLMPGRKMRLSPDTPIQGTVQSVLDFWQWAHSDLLNNVSRGKLAEFIVGSALGLVDEPSVRIEWDGCDFHYRGKTIEVKSSAFLQAWPQEDYSKIEFDIAPRDRHWKAISNELTVCNPPVRVADCYVFCLFTEKDPEKAQASLFDMRFWRFYVLPTRILDEKFETQEKVRLSVLETLAAPIAYEYLKHAIEDALA